MESRAYLNLLHLLEKMKCNTRHNWTSTGRRESVAEHSYRLAVMAFLLRNEFPGIDMDRVLQMCLIHDWGEAITGDIPSFLKTSADERTEDAAFAELIKLIPEQKAEINSLFAEFAALETPEARVFKALDKLEAVIQHNEAPIGTWIPLERELNLSYGEAECEEFPFLAELRALVRQDTEKKIVE